MKFKVSRTSVWDMEQKPCEEAFSDKFVVWDVRSCSEEYYNKYYAGRHGEWRDNGKNHKQIRNGEYIARQLDDEDGWAVKLNSITEIIDFIKKYDRVVITAPDKDKPGEVFQLEIYDDYRE